MHSLEIHCCVLHKQVSSTAELEEYEKHSVLEIRIQCLFGLDFEKGNLHLLIEDAYPIAVDEGPVSVIQLVDVSLVYL